MRGMILETQTTGKDSFVSEEMPKVALVIVAHPDDAEFGCGGTIAEWSRQGWTVHYVICTDGTAGGPDDATDVGPEARRALNQLRKAEQRAACDALGVTGELVFLDHPDGLLEPSIDLRRTLVRLMRTYRPARLLFQSPDRVWEQMLMVGRHHPDHMAAGQATLAAVYPASQNPWDFPELLAEGLMPHMVKELYIMGAPTRNFYVDTSAVIEQKIASLRAHESQLGAVFEQVEKGVRERDALVGATFGAAFAEGFHRVIR